MLVDWQIKQLCNEYDRIKEKGKPLPMIEPFSEGVQGNGVISYGLTHAGYDLRLALEILQYNKNCDEVIDPKMFGDEEYRKKVFVKHTLQQGERFILRPHDYVLGRSMEYLRIPKNIKATCVGKSTLARSLIVINTTPLEPGWCTSPDTEALTPEGWKNIVDVIEGDLILTRNQEGFAEYKKVEKKHEYDYEGNLLRFKGRSIDQLVTPDHKLFVWSRYRNRPFLANAKDIFGKYNYSFDREVRFEGTHPKTITINDRVYDTLDFAEFYGCWLGDGSAFHGNDGGYKIKLAVVTKERKRKLYKSVLDKLGITNYHLEERGYRWYDKSLATWLMQHGHAKEKFVRPEFLSMGSEVASKILFGLIQSDGNLETNTFTTSSKRLADCAQILAFMSGAVAIIRKVKHNFRGEDLIGYKVRVVDVQTTPKMPPKNHSVKPYKGKVYCVTVPNHVWFMRRNGKASWTGNCGHLTIEIGNVSPLRACIYGGEGIAQIEFTRLEAEPLKSYADKKGKYQGQLGVQPPIVN